MSEGRPAERRASLARQALKHERSSHMRANRRSSLRHRVRGALTGPEWRTVAAMAAVVIGLHLVGFFILIAVIAPRHYQLGATGSFTVGLGVTAYMLGLRHAFDADHIAAI